MMWMPCRQDRFLAGPVQGESQGVKARRARRACSRPGLGSPAAAQQHGAPRSHLRLQAGDVARQQGVVQGHGGCRHGRVSEEHGQRRLLRCAAAGAPVGSRYCVLHGMEICCVSVAASRLRSCAAAPASSRARQAPKAAVLIVLHSTPGSAQPARLIWLPARTLTRTGTRPRAVAIERGKAPDQAVPAGWWRGGCPGDRWQIWRTAVQARAVPCSGPGSDPCLAGRANRRRTLFAPPLRDLLASSWLCCSSCLDSLV